MDREDIKILKTIQDYRDRDCSVWYEELQKKGFNVGRIKSLQERGFIVGVGIFGLTDMGSDVLRQELILENLKKQNLEKKKIIFDTNIYDKIVSGELSFSLLEKNKSNFEFHTTHIQIDEMLTCSDLEKRKMLGLFLTKVSPKVIPTESGVWGVSRWGEFKWGDGEVAKEIKKDNVKHIEDSLIGETAIKQNLILVTEDDRLHKRVNELDGISVKLNEFLEMLE